MLAHDILDGTWYSSAKNNAINGVLLEVTVERASVSQGVKELSWPWYPSPDIHSSSLRSSGTLCD